MRIFIESIEDAFTEQGTDSGYRVTFRSDLTRGTALLAASHDSSPHSFLRQELFVEVEAQAYQEVRPLSAEEAAEYRFTALPQAGCFQLVGEVVYVSENNDTNYPLISVCVADAQFHWEPDQRVRGKLFAGLWISFQVAGLVLWNMNL